MTDPGQSLYNRYRPQTFQDLVGQEHVARTLGNALERGTIAHGFLFSGPRGTGKTTTARILARCLNCQSFPAPTATPCGECDSCRRIGRDDWLDVVEVDAASSARRIDEMREWLESVRYAPVASRYRVTIMDEAHQIQEGAASALLKTLEEPPPQLVVILCTTHPWDILPTIRSRLQTYSLRKPGVANLMTVLERVARAEGIEAGPQALDLVARAADGSYRDALGLLDQISTFGGGTVQVADALDLLGVVSREALFDLVDLMAQGDAAGAFEMLESALDGGADPEQLMRGLITHLRYACLLQQGAQAREDWALSPEELDRLHAQANQLSPSQVVRAIDLIADAQVRIRHGQADPRIQLELVAAKLSNPALVNAAGTAAPQGGQPPTGSSPPSPPVATQVPAPVAPKGAPEADEPADDDAPPRAPAPAAAQPVPADAEHIGRAWPTILSTLEQGAPHLHAFLQGSQVQSVEDDVLTVGVNGGVAVTMLGRPDEKARIAGVVRQVCGQDIGVAFTELAAAPAPSAAQQQEAGGDAGDGPVDHQQIIDEIRAAFDAELIDTDNRE
ncbi:MAG: DNA polymerase III subunit gamma/tau [Actinomycetota bacterium]|nr:DNA polymerase III subunit gamma/tau [Actinomycetota bacterium]